MNDSIDKELLYHLHNLHSTCSFDQVELNNFMHVFLKFVFRENGLNADDYNIDIRFSNDVFDDAYAYATSYKQNGETMYLVVFRKTPNYINKLYFDLKQRKKSFTRHGKERAKKETSNVTDIRFDATLRAIVTAGHEFHHLIQYIKESDSLEADSEYQFNICLMAEDDYTTALSKRESRAFKNSIYSYLDCFGGLSDIELDADRNSIKYCKKMVETLRPYAKEEDFIKFLNYIDSLFTEFKKDRGDILSKSAFVMNENSRLINRYIKKIDKQERPRKVSRDSYLHSDDLESLIESLDSTNS